MWSVSRRCVKNLLSNKYFARKYTKQQENVLPKKKYTDTVLLPKTKFASFLKNEKRVEMDNYLLEVFLQFAFLLYSWY